MNDQRKRFKTRWPGLSILPCGRVQVIDRDPDGRQRSHTEGMVRWAREWQLQRNAGRSRGAWTHPAGVRVQPTIQTTDRPRLVTHILPRFGDLPPGRIDLAMVKAWGRDLEAGGLSWWTVQGADALVASVMVGAVEVDLIARSPCRPVNPGWLLVRL